MRRLTPFPLVILLGLGLSLAAIGSQRNGADLAAAAPVTHASAETPDAIAVVTQPQPAVALDASKVALVQTQPVLDVAPDRLAAVAANLVVETSSGVADRSKASALLDAMNTARGRESLPLFKSSGALEDVAVARARDLVENGYFAHFAPDGGSAFSELAVRGIAYRLAGENLARNNYPAAGTVQVAFDSLMASPGHRANILEERFRRVGVAAVQSGRTWLYVTIFTDAE